MVSFTGFVTGFSGGIIIIAFIQTVIGNAFITAFVGGLIIGVLAALIDW